MVKNIKMKAWSITLMSRTNNQLQYNLQLISQNHLSSNIVILNASL